MKTTILGDTHGRPLWKDIVDKENPDLLVFLGDYFDTHDDISLMEQISNFKQIMEYKKIKDTICLIGNHDFHYMDVTTEIYSGHAKDIAPDKLSELRKVVDAYFPELTMAYEQDGYLMTHAGVSRAWLDKYGISFNPEIISDEINRQWKYQPQSFEFRRNIGATFSKYGDDVTHSPIWIRPRSLIMSSVNMHQIVGHTTKDDIITVPIDDNKRLMFIDTLGHSKKYVNIEDGQIVIKGL